MDTLVAMLWLAVIAGLALALIVSSTLLALRITVLLVRVTLTILRVTGRLVLAAARWARHGPCGQPIERIEARLPVARVLKRTRRCERIDHRLRRPVAH